MLGGNIQATSEGYSPRAARPSGRARRRDHEDRRKGTRNTVLTVEPKGVGREATVTRRRAKQAFSRESKRIIERPRYRQATRIPLVLENLHTHVPSSFLETGGKRTAHRIRK
ncbi:MAG: hypothetical protein C4293_20830, partial [Nitrospiraceae bacterium]